MEFFKSIFGKRASVNLPFLRVVILKDGEQWFAQGIEVDYSACGSSVTEVQQKFVEGLCRSIAASMAKHGSAERFLRPAPESLLKEMGIDVNQLHFEQSPKVSLDEGSCSKPLPYKAAAFLQPAHA